MTSKEITHFDTVYVRRSANFSNVSQTSNLSPGWADIWIHYTLQWLQWCTVHLTIDTQYVLNSSDLFLVFPVSSEYYRTAQPCARTAGSCCGQRLLSFITAGEVTSVAQDNNKGDEITTADLWDTSVLWFFFIWTPNTPSNCSFRGCH